MNLEKPHATSSGELDQRGMSDSEFRKRENYRMAQFNETFTRLYNAETELDGVFGGMGRDIKVCPPLHIENGANIYIGDDVHINIGARINGIGGTVCFHERTLIGPYLKVDTVVNRGGGVIERGDVLVGKDVWIGGGVTIEPGVTIGAGSVVAAGSKVETDIPANVVVVGSPARVVKEIKRHDREIDLERIKRELALPRMSSGDIFYTSASDAVEEKQMAYERYSGLNRGFTHLTGKEIGKIFGGVGNGVNIKTPIYYSLGRFIFLGNDIDIQEGVFLGDAGRIEIGDGVAIGSEVQIYTTNHLLHKDERSFIEPKDVKIGKNVTLGRGVVVLPGVTIGNGAKITEGSVVKDDIPPGALASGIPAKTQASHC